MNVCVHALFEAQVARTPEATALVFNDRALSYAELNAQANRLAHFLRAHGAGPETLVGVSLPRCPEMVIALLGALKAGAAYVPLDPSYPQERLAFMVADANVLMLVSDENGKTLFPSVQDRIVCIDSDWGRISRESDANPGVTATPAHPAYVMYTSGSTGKPKGAVIVHSGLSNYLEWAIAAYRPKAGRSVPVHSSISFDLTVTSLYPALLAGGTVELLPEEAGAQHLIEALRRTKSRSLVKITPAHLELLSAELAPSEVAGMTDLFVIGGENLTAESLRFWRKFAPSTRLVNEYGPTETVVGCCVYEVQPDDPQHGPVPIGYPIANTRLYVLDASLQPAKRGETGELYIAGAGVARGYLNRAELTRERFVPDLASMEPGACMYKSGDLARYRKDGVLEYLGRVDNQVKIRGFRVELGEIEETLAAHDAVQSCAVMAREDSPGDRQLVAYVVRRKGELRRAGELQDFLKQRLPPYMMPARFMFLDALPLTHNGKVDRRSLPAPSATTPADFSEFHAPSSTTQRELAAIWSELLDLERIGIDDDVFNLGAHSLMTMRAQSRIRDRFDVDLPLRCLFEYPTVARLAEIIDKMNWISQTRRSNATGAHQSTAERVEVTF